MRITLAARVSGIWLKRMCPMVMPRISNMRGTAAWPTNLVALITTRARDAQDVQHEGDHRR